MPRTRSYLIASILTAALLAASCVGTESAQQNDRRALSPLRRAAPAGSREGQPFGPHSAPMRFVLIGDQGSGDSPQYAIARRMCRWRHKHPFKLVFTSGDNVYDHGEPTRFVETFYNPYKCLLDNGAQFHASLGNHDVETADGAAELADPHFGFKDGEGNYVIRKRGVRFVVVDAPHMDLEWLRHHTREEAGDRWTIVIFHFPVYSPGPHGSEEGYRPGLPRLFQRRGVDLVINGHDHLYSVSKRFKGIRYVVSGGGGASTYDCSRKWFTAICRERHHFLYVTAGRRRIKVRAVPQHGKPFHSFTTTGRKPEAP